MIGIGINGRKLPGLLVSVRSADEAVEAVNGGASVVDIKEPDGGPLGRASPTIWRAVREVVPPTIPVSVALGELADWESGEAHNNYYKGISFRKLGLAGVGADWQARWAEIRKAEEGETCWVAVAYADWALASSPGPLAVLEAAIAADNCSGILVDTWDKTKPSPLAPTREWQEWVGLAHQASRFVALAGGLDQNAITRLKPLEPDLFAVRGAACDGRDRNGMVRADHVARLIQVIKDDWRSF